MKVAMTGANGFVALHVKKEFTDFIVIERNDTEDEILEKLQGVDVVMNFAGAPIIKRWTESYKEVLISSRVETTKKLVNAINKSDVKHFISTSAVGAYPSDQLYDEHFSWYGYDFLAKLTQNWEYEANKCEKLTTIVRFGVVLGKDGGALAKMLLPFKLGLGGPIGHGQMMMSWIDIDDLVRAYMYIIDNKIDGIVNGVAPNAVSNNVFTKALANVLNRPAIFPLPIFVLKLLFGEGSTVLTASKEIYPRVLIDSGFEFKYPDIESSLQHLLQ